MKQLSIPKDFSTVALFDIIAKGLAAVTSILLIRVLTVQVYASYVKFNAISSLVFSVIGTSMAVAYARGGTEYTSRGYKCLKTIYAICISILFGATIILGAFAPLMSKLYTATVGIAILSLLYGFIQSVNKVNESYFQVKGKYSTAGLLDNAKSLCLVVILLIALVVSITLTEYVTFTLFIISSLVPVSIGLQKIYKEERNIVEDKLDKATTKIILLETGVLILYWLLLNLIDQTDVVLVNQMMDDSALSNYGVALKYYQLLLTLQASLSTVLRIRTSKKEVIDSKKRQAEISIKWIKKTFLFILIVLIVTNLFAAPIMNLLNGERYSNAIDTFRVFTVGAAISYLFAPNVAVMMSAKKYKTLCLFTICGFAINAIIDILLIPRIGIIAAAMATVTGNAFLNIASFFTILKRGKEEN